jgi:VIT1/CCC1 family predicted Fe2+/Mn2+ transporter
MTRHPRRHIPLGADNFLSVLEGIEGGFAIFVGIVAGLYFQNISHDLLIVTGVISLIVNAFNSSAVRYASEHYIDELDGHEKKSRLHAYFIPASIEFVTYALVSLIAVIPLLVIRESVIAIMLSTTLTVLILFVAGWYRGSLFGRHAVRDGVELASLGVAIIAVGAIAGWALSHVVA